jgi:hypothetical protein
MRIYKSSVRDGGSRLYILHISLYCMVMSIFSSMRWFSKYRLIKKLTWDCIERGSREWTPFIILSTEVYTAWSRSCWPYQTSFVSPSLCGLCSRHTTACYIWSVLGISFSWIRNQISCKGYWFLGGGLGSVVDWGTKLEGHEFDSR